MKGPFEQKEYRRNGAEAIETVAVNSGRNGTDSIIIMAPHAGIRINTGKQAKLIHDRLATQGVTTWIFKGGSGEYSAHDTWYVTAHDISGENPQFDLFEEYIGYRSYYQGILLRGYSNDGIVISAPESTFKRILTNKLRKLLPANISIEIAHDNHKFAGTSDQNIVNRLSENGLQIIQSKHVRENYWEEVAECLATAFAESH